MFRSLLVAKKNVCPSRKLKLEALEIRSMLASDVGVSLAPNLSYIDTTCLWLPIEVKPSANTSPVTSNTLLSSATGPLLVGPKTSSSFSPLNAAITPTQELWVPASKTVNVNGSWPVTAFGNADFAFSVPANFTSFVKAMIVVIPRATTSTTYSLKSTVAKDGQSATTVSNQLTGQGPVSLVASIVKEIDATTLFNSALTAGVDNVSIHFETANQTVVQVVGMRFVSCRGGWSSRTNWPRRSDWPRRRNGAPRTGRSYWSTRQYGTNWASRCNWAPRTNRGYRSSRRYRTHGSSRASSDSNSWNNFAWRWFCRKSAGC